MRYALSRGHKVTTFNRGKSHPGELPSEVEQLIGDRNGQLDALKGRTWDVVIDNPTTLPVWVRDAAQILKGNVDRYVFTSTISVYQDSKTGLDENAPLQSYEGADPYKETLESMKANGFKVVRTAQSAFRKGGGEMVSRKNADHPAWTNRWATGRERSLYLLAGSDRSRRRSACAG